MQTNKTPFSKVTLASFMYALAISPVTLAEQHRQPSAWTCTNQDLEISCDDNGCQASEAFTPMSIFVSTDEISVCAYTGCWEGEPTSIHSASHRFEVYTGESLPFSTAPESTASASITVDRESGIATLIVADIFAHPMLCKPSQR